MTGVQKPREEDTTVSVLKEKRTTSKAEYVNTANQIYVKTVDFLSRLSARYSRLIAAEKKQAGPQRRPGRADGRFQLPEHVQVREKVLQRRALERIYT